MNIMSIPKLFPIINANMILLVHFVAAELLRSFHSVLRAPSAVPSPCEFTTVGRLGYVPPILLNLSAFRKCCQVMLTAKHIQHAPSPSRPSLCCESSLRQVLLWSLDRHLTSCVHPRFPAHRSYHHPHPPSLELLRNCACDSPKRKKMARRDLEH